MTDDECIAELKSGSLLASVRRSMYTAHARIEQLERQKRPPTLIEIRKIELEEAQKIIDLVKDSIKPLRLGDGGGFSSYGRR